MLRLRRRRCRRPSPSGRQSILCHRARPLAAPAPCPSPRLALPRCLIDDRCSGERMLTPCRRARARPAPCAGGGRGVWSAVGGAVRVITRVGSPPSPRRAGDGAPPLPPSGARAPPSGIFKRGARGSLPGPPPTAASLRAEPAPCHAACLGGCPPLTLRAPLAAPRAPPLRRSPGAVTCTILHFVPCLALDPTRAGVTFCRSGASTCSILQQIVKHIVCSYGNQGQPARYAGWPVNMVHLARRQGWVVFAAQISTRPLTIGA